MSVLMTLRAQGDPGELEKHAGANREAMRDITEKAKSHGLIAHRFYGSTDGQIMVVDEWPDQESFQAFFAEAQAQIEPLMAAAGVSSEPEVTFWRSLETHDEAGWNA